MGLNEVSDLVAFLPDRLPLRAWRMRPPVASGAGPDDFESALRRRTQSTSRQPSDRGYFSL